jgi:hypothetical protein
MTVWVWATYGKKVSFFVGELIGTLWVVSWWLSMCLIASLLSFQVDATYCLWVMLLTFPMMAVRPSHLVLGALTVSMPALQLSVSSISMLPFVVFPLFVLCALMPLLLCWLQWRYWAKKDGAVATIFHWIYAVAIACYCAFYLTLFLQEGAAFDWLFSRFEYVRENLFYFSLVAPLLLGALKERDLPLYRRPLMLMGSFGMGALLLIITACTVLQSDPFGTFCDALLKTLLMMIVVGVSVPKTFANEGIFLPFIPLIWVSFSVPYATLLVSLVAGAVMIVMSLRREDRWTANLALSYALASLFVNLFAVRSLSRPILGLLLILCGALFLGLNHVYNRWVKRGEA